MNEKVHITKRLHEGKTLCGISSSEWINAVVEWPAEDFCPECVAKLVAYLTSAAPDTANACPDCKGRGYIDNQTWQSCTVCKGSGQAQKQPNSLP
jgi:hypothetical protein